MFFKIRIDKARVAFNRLHNFWKCKKLALKTKIILNNSIVKSFFLYGAECWRPVKTETNQTKKNLQSVLAKIKCECIEAEVKNKI